MTDNENLTKLGEWFLRANSLFFGLIITMGSCVLTCRHIVLNDAAPNFNNAWYLNPAIWFLFSKIAVGGIGTTAAQIYGAVLYRKTGESYYAIIFWMATCLSISVSILTYYANDTRGAVTAKYATQQYQTLSTQKENYEDRVKNLKRVRNAYFDGEYTLQLNRRKAGKRNYYTRAEQTLATKEDQIAKAQEKLDKANEALIAYQTKQTASSDEVNAKSTYAGFSRDALVSIGAYNDDTHDWFKTIMPLLILLMFSTIPDLTGPKLLAYGLIGDIPNRRRKTLIARYKGLKKTYLTIVADMKGDLPLETEETEASMQSTKVEVDLDEKEQRRINKLEGRSIKDLTTKDINDILAQAPDIVEAIPTLKGRHYIEASPDAGKTTLLRMLIFKAIERGEIAPGKCILRIHDMKPFKPGVWPEWAEVKGSNYNIAEIKASLEEMEGWARNGVKKPPVYVIQDEQLQIADDYLEKYKEPIGKKYTWLITFARTLDYYFTLATQLGTAETDGTPGRAGLRNRYDMQIQIIYDKISNLRFAVVGLGYRKRFFNLPNFKHEFPYSSTTKKPNPAAQEAKPSIKQELPELPTELPKSNNVIPIQKLKPKAQATPNKEGLPRDLQKYYDQTEPNQRELILSMKEKGESNNQIIKTVFGCNPTPAKRKCLKAVLLNQEGSRKVKVK